MQSPARMGSNFRGTLKGLTQPCRAAIGTQGGEVHHAPILTPDLDIPPS
jgi:hypothetical protein